MFSEEKVMPRQASKQAYTSISKLLCNTPYNHGSFITFYHFALRDLFSNYYNKPYLFRRSLREAEAAI